MSRPKGSGLAMAFKNLKDDESRPRGKMTAYAFFVQVKMTAYAFFVQVKMTAYAFFVQVKMTTYAFFVQVKSVLKCKHGSICLAEVRTLIMRIQIK